MATAGLTLALMTVGQRRANDTGLTMARHKPQQQHPDTPAEAPATAVAPDKLEGLGYLPRETDLVAGVHVAELLALPAGRQLLHQPFTLAGRDFPVETLAGWIGLHVEDLDHLVVGLALQNRLIPRLDLVARSKAAFDPEALQRQLGGQRVTVAGKKTVVYTPKDSPSPLALYCPNDRTAIVALAPEELQVVPSEPFTGLEQFGPELREVLRDRREPTAPLWVAGHVENWAKSFAGRALQRLKKEQAERLTLVRTFGLFVQLDRGVAVTGALRCKDDASAKALDEYFHALRPGSDPNLKTVVEGPWLSMQLHTELAAIFKPMAP
jgi:hypothetical protein